MLSSKVIRESIKKEFSHMVGLDVSYIYIRMSDEIDAVLNIVN